MNVENKPVLSVLEASEYLGMPRNKVYDLCKIKGFPVITIGRRKFIPKEKLNEWLNDNAGKTIIMDRV
ncbi:helix-turn-helix domain-containing protein [Eubacterium callanderi]|uniref:helix-turn-helix domain-containing protein n=1 Tax=Eubacterium callanderi TaxID=53442 RepID=UPI0029FF3B3A|nr:helix-turn-helix domain-containing protein [Eubacterium callanderi]